jgi:glucose-1-phosphate cytidylyltransferase
MKVVLFCGGLGTRLRDYSESVPKPMVNIGYRPILWNLMKYYSYYGHKDFILCLGYKADFIKNYFLNYNECLSNDFVLSGGGKQLLMLNSDIQDWKITFVDTGLHSNIGQRLKAVEKHLAGEQMFLANYSDGLTDLPLDHYIDNFIRHDKVASFVSVRPNQTFHIVSTKDSSIVTDISHINYADIRINGGFFAFKTEIFKYINEGEELVVEPFQKLIDKQELITYKYDGFWACMDTFKDKQMFDDMYAQGKPIWEVWKTSNSSSSSSEKPDKPKESITLKELVELNEGI